LWIPLFVFTWLPLSSIPQMLNKLFNAPISNQTRIIKIKGIVYRTDTVYNIFLYFKHPHIRYLIIMFFNFHNNNIYNIN
jgi:hypothetical protein